jgi:CDGSH-type Zn-finger protein
MARLIRHERTGPIKIEPQDKPIWVCGCGLSRTFPICDGTHKGRCKDEQPGTLYVYAPDNETILETRPDTGP